MNLIRATIVILVLGLTGCTVGDSTAQEILTDEGYHNIRLTGWAPFSCSDDDTFKSHFVASRTILNADGTTTEREVRGTICCGWFKDCTVRH